MSKAINRFFALLAAPVVAAQLGVLWPASAQAPEYAEPYANIGPAGKTCKVKIGNVHHTSYSGRWVGLVGGGVVMAVASGVQTEDTPTAATAPKVHGNLPEGMTFYVTLQSALSDDSTVAGNVIEALTISPLPAGSVTVPPGSMLRGRIVAAPASMNGVALKFHRLILPDGNSIPLTIKVLSLESALPPLAASPTGASTAATTSGVIATADGLVFLKGTKLVIPAGQVLQVQLLQAAQVDGSTKHDAF